MKKSLLTESEIRKFMKFANLGTLAENFIDSNIEEEITEDTVAEDTVTEDTVAEDTVAEDTVTEEVLTEEDVDVKDLVIALMDVIEDKTGVPVTVQDDPEASDEGEVDLEDPSADIDADPVDEPLSDPELPGDEAPESGAMAPEEDEAADFLGEELVQEVTRRVAARLLKKNKK